MRLRYLLLAPLIVAVGLASRHPLAPDLVRAWAGDPLYAVLIYVLLKVVRPDLGLARGAVITWAVCATIEVSQAIDLPWLVAVRGTHIGALVLGRGFLVSDLVGYAVGAWVAAGVEAVRRNGRLRSEQG